MRYIQAAFGQRTRDEYYVYLPHLDVTVVASTEEKVKHEAWRVIEDSEGLHSFTVVWSS